VNQFKPNYLSLNYLKKINIRDFKMRSEQDRRVDSISPHITPGDDLGERQNKSTINMEGFQFLELDKQLNESQRFLSDPKNRIWVNDLDDSIRD
jgi:hypothetical protein